MHILIAPIGVLIGCTADSGLHELANRPPTGAGAHQNLLTAMPDALRVSFRDQAHVIAPGSLDLDAVVVFHPVFTFLASMSL
mmetsp:Transcript_12643/g.34997  ORF Transcript_12643/g.34997 Transcript_12643/m.34997 type:complete len:82 (+) Transcript_12643:1646-1891(+)